MSASYSVFTSPNHAPIPNHLPTLIVTPHGQPHHTLYSYIHTNFNKESYLLTPSPQGDLCVAKMVPPPGSRGPGGPGAGQSDPGHGAASQDRAVRCEASRNLQWSIMNTGIHAPVYKLTLPNPDAPGSEQPLFQISKPNPNAPHWTMFYFTYAGHLIPPKRIEFGKIQKNAAQGAGGGGGTRVTITGKSPEEKAVWQTLGEGNEDMVEWIVLCAALNVLDDEIIKAAAGSSGSPTSPTSAGSTVPARREPSGGRLGHGPPPSSSSSSMQNGRGQPVPSSRPIASGSSGKGGRPLASSSTPTSPAMPGGHHPPMQAMQQKPPGNYGAPPRQMGGASPAPMSSGSRPGHSPQGYPQGYPAQQQQHYQQSGPPQQGGPGFRVPPHQQGQMAYGGQGPPPPSGPGFARPPPMNGYVAPVPQGQPARRF